MEKGTGKGKCTSNLSSTVYMSTGNGYYILTSISNNPKMQCNAMQNIGKTHKQRAISS